MELVLEAARLLVKHGVAVDTQDKFGRTALHLAAELKDLPLSAFLLSERANPNLPDRLGRTPFLSAAEHVDLSVDSGKIIRLFLACGANLNAQDATTKLRVAFYLDSDKAHPEARSAFIVASIIRPNRDEELKKALPSPSVCSIM